MDYNEYYMANQNAFGEQPEKILLDHTHLIPRKSPILDVGAGQGRNTIYLSELGFQVDAMDPSSVSINTLEEIKLQKKLRFNTLLTDFKDFPETKRYSAVLVFGLIQILDRDEVALLKNKISGWLKNGGLLFLTSFTIEDDSHKTIRENSLEIGKNSYLKPNGEKRTFFEPGEIKKLFQEYEPLYYREGLGPRHRHGNGPYERHAMVETVLLYLDNSSI